MSGSVENRLNTQVISVKDGYDGHFENVGSGWKNTWVVPSEQSSGLETMKRAANLLKTSDIPVAFPTETVYGLGADATRSSAVKGIYKAKGRPSDNPLIIHVSDLNMLCDFLPPPETVFGMNTSANQNPHDRIPPIYKALVDCYWPGPLTILLPNQPNSKLAPEVTAGNKTFAVRMPESKLAQTLIKLAGVPIAAPSANASTKPSPTTAQHVLHDLDGKIELIIDGGPCTVGVESTVVDGLNDPPLVLRPGGISIEKIRQCAGWETVQIGYTDRQQNGDSAPRAPGMKYKHYSPKAKVILVEGAATAATSDWGVLKQELLSVTDSPQTDTLTDVCTIGIVRTKQWDTWGGWEAASWACVGYSPAVNGTTDDLTDDSSASCHPIQSTPNRVKTINGELECFAAELYSKEGCGPPLLAKLLSISLGRDTTSIAHSLFSALRELDEQEADVIYVEGISSDDGDDISAAVMNRLRKAASVVKRY